MATLSCGDGAMSSICRVVPLPPSMPDNKPLGDSLRWRLWKGGGGEEEKPQRVEI